MIDECYFPIDPLAAPAKVNMVITETASVEARLKTQWED
jgi:hypothetical protein